MTKVKQTGKAVSIPKGLLIGTLYALAVTLAGTSLIAKLVEIEALSPDKIGYTIMVLLIVAAWTGATVSTYSIKRRILLISLLSGGCYCTMLLATTALLFGGEYYGVGETVILIICGSMLPVLLQSYGRSGRKGRKIKIRNC